MDNLEKLCKNFQNLQLGQGVAFHTIMAEAVAMVGENKRLNGLLTAANGLIDNQKREYAKLLRSRNALKGQITKLKK